LLALGALDGGHEVAPVVYTAGETGPPTSLLNAPPAAPLDPTATPETEPEPAATTEPQPTAVPPTPVPPTAVPAPPTPVPAPPTQAPAPPTPVPPTPVPPAPTQPPAPPAAAAGMHPMEQAMFQSHNVQRGGAGLAALTVDARLMQVARQRAQDMAAKNYFAHTSPTGETAFTILGQIGYAYQLAGENIARNNFPDSETVQVSMNGFMNSAGHRANILEPVFRRVGIGVAFSGDGMKYFAVVFSN
jgi:uncharacterized protein YkwD